MTLLNRAAHILDIPSTVPFSAILVRTPQELAQVQALIIPGGESTAISIGAQRAGLLEDLRKWVANDRPTWGTCAGMIMLAREASGGKRGGQEIIGGIDVRVGRNGFGSQVDSFETQLDFPALGKEPFPAVFIRAPVVDCLLDPDVESLTSQLHSTTVTTNGAASAAPPDHETLDKKALPLVIAPPLSTYRDEPSSSSLAASSFPNSADPAADARAASNSEASGTKASFALKRPPIQILATLPEPIADPVAPPHASATAAAGTLASDQLAGLPRPEKDHQIVALRQGNLMSTSFHPELTPDARIHSYFLRDIVLPTLVIAADKSSSSTA